MATDDDVLASGLVEALRVDDEALPDRPSEERLERLRSAIAGAADAGAGGAVAARPDDAGADESAPDERLDRSPSRTQWLAVAASLVVVFAAGVLLGTAPPGPLRDAAASVGLPVDSSREVATNRAIDDLGVALDDATVAASRGDVDDAQLDRVAETDADMLDTVSDLDSGELAELRPVAHQVHLRAVALFDSLGRRLPTASDSDLAEV